MICLGPETVLEPEPSTVHGSPQPATTVAPVVYECTLRHIRRAPIHNDFTYRTYLWLVDLDDVPRFPGPLRFLAGFRSRDHFGPPDFTLRASVDHYLAEHGIDLHGGRVLMLANARVLGHVFNPLSVYWCHAASGELACIIAEVHNTYGGRHCYLLTPDAAGRAEAEKGFYVSPFIPIDGVYRMSLPEPGERLHLTIRLDLPGRPPFVAVLRGRRKPAGIVGLLRASLRHPLPTLQVAARIRLQGIKLYLRGLPVVPRPRIPRRSIFRPACRRETG